MVALASLIPLNKSFCGTSIESIKLIIVPTVVPIEIGIAIWSILFNTSGLLLTFFIPFSFLTSEYLIYKYANANMPPPAAPSEAPPAEYSIPFGKRIIAIPTPTITRPICSNICETPVCVMFCIPWKNPLNTFTNDIIIGAKEIAINE